MSFLRLSIDVTKLDKNKLHAGKPKNGHTPKYAFLCVYENEEPDQFGQTHIVKEDLTQEERAAGTKAKIVGNGKVLGGERRPAPAKATAPATADDDDVNF